MANLPVTMGTTAAVALGVSPGDFIGRLLGGDTVGGAIQGMLGMKKRKSSPMDEIPNNSPQRPIWSELPDDNGGDIIPASPY